MTNASDLWARASALVGFEVREGMPVVMTSECSGGDHTDEQWTTPIGAAGKVCDVEANPVQGVQVTVAIYCCADPDDGGVRNIVNSFDEADGEPRWPFRPATYAVEVLATEDGVTFKRPIHWSDEDQDKAEADGWYLAEGTDIVLVADDEGRFADAGGGNHSAAYDHVLKLASDGDEHAIRALLIHQQGAMDSWLRELPMARPDIAAFVAEPNNASLDGACTALSLALVKAGKDGLPGLTVGTILGGALGEFADRAPALIARLVSTGSMVERDGRYFAR